VETLNGQKERCRKGKMPSSKEEENVARVLLKNIEIKRRTKKNLDNDWLNINGEPPYKKIIS
jgi:hypothetical protein